MAEVLPPAAAPRSGLSVAAPLFDRDGGPVLTRIRSFTAQEPVKKLMPAFVALATVGLAALAWAQLSPSPQRMLYSDINDADRASVTQLLDSQGINWNIDNATGVLTVDEEDFYKARMLAATDTSIGAPESGLDMLDSLPLGASKTMEGERLRIARERELQMTIGEIDGVESVRVHLAEAERSAFVRENTPPSASVMVRLARGHQLSDSQVRAVVNLVAASVPGMSVDAVRVADQQGRLLSDPVQKQDDRLDLQARIEEKLRGQLSHLLTPMFGAGNFTTEIQAELDMDEVTRASESYDKDGALRTENVVKSQSTNSGNAQGIPGAVSNTPPPAANAEERAPEGGETRQGGEGANESSASRTYELGREVSVANTTPGDLKRLSVAVAVSDAALKGASAQELESIKALISSAVGVNVDRGDQVTVIARSFEPVEPVVTAFYEEPWFARLLRIGGGFLVALLIVLFGLRPLLKSLRKKSEDNGKDEVIHIEGKAAPVVEGPKTEAESKALLLMEEASKRDDLNKKVALARELIEEKPADALAALREMLGDSSTKPQPEAS
ncbi:flagellar basal-body MS-ring/collar protein FliF [Croceicoccus gelatinilyticus]|uniref:flagellar basal-body MS-ring/collar protein FliF n=1 Tax=Croceicoccus gelatinilyticus TaxID=2835536 RepID=UPI001BCFFEDA|nr:flagellar basal-body MS-ring/collar protein FliF [Croceicoccus gelatinilyticus]MBS7671330.1 flagellar M-ring protein FliF [Croceicoccus gelatinilyticus]